VPIAFVSEHSETLVELDIEYKELADKNGCKNYTRVPALGTNKDFIKADEIRDVLLKSNIILEDKPGITNWRKS
jgi:ferrochelatase